MSSGNGMEEPWGTGCGGRVAAGVVVGRTRVGNIPTCDGLVSPMGRWAAGPEGGVGPLRGVRGGGAHGRRRFDQTPRPEFRFDGRGQRNLAR